MHISKIILSSDENELYLQFWPIACAMWTRAFRIQPVLAFLTDRQDDDPLLNELRQHGVVIPIRPLDFHDSGIPVSIQAKVIRMFMATQFVEDTVLLGDIDILPINVFPFLQNLSKLPDNHIVTFGANAYESTADHGKFPMNYLVAHGSVFRQVVNPQGLSFHELLKTWRDIKDPIDNKESVNQPFLRFSDESLLRCLLHRNPEFLSRVVDYPRALFQQDQIPWVVQKHPVTGEDMKVRAFVAANTDRIDRQDDKVVIRTPVENKENVSLDINSYVDIHCCRPFQKFINSYVRIFAALNVSTNSILPYPLQSHRYVTGNDFKEYADHVIDETFFKGVPLDPSTIGSGDTIFVKTDLVPFFFTNVFPRIKYPIILITHNSDHSTPGPFACTLDDPNLIHWFGQNCDLREPHPKFTTIPIGIANFRRRDTGEFVPHSNQQLIHDKSKTTIDLDIKMRIPKVLCNFDGSMDMYGHRKEASEALKSKLFVMKTEKTDFPNYLEMLSQFGFIASPHGNGLDCHRTWEAIIMGCVPIVKTSSLDSMYYSNKFPVLVVNKWEDLNAELLNKTAKNYIGKVHLFGEHPGLTFNYWRKKIDAVKKKHLDEWLQSVD